MKKAISLIAILFVMSSCYCINFKKGSGNVTLQVHNVHSFSSVNLAATFDVILIPSDSAKVIVETDDNLQELVVVENSDNCLVVKMKPNTNIRKRIAGKIFIYTKELEEIKNASVGQLENEGVLYSKKLVFNNKSVGKTVLTIKTDNFIVNNSAVGTTELHGNCNNLNIKNKAVGKFDASDLQCNYLDMENSAVGSTSVLINTEGKIQNSGVGSLDVYGKGVISEISNSGVGKFTKH